MGLSQALYSGISGLSNHQVRMDNVGNNLANVNTVGFKKGVHQFNTLFSQTVRGGTAPSDNRGAINPVQMGLGTSTSSINQQFTQGSLQTTGNQRDMAVEGNGFFVLDTGIEGTWGRAYTRDGTFYLDTDGRLLAGEGLRVMGVQADTGEIEEAASATEVTIPIGKTGAARETSEVAMTGNLNSDVDVAKPNIVTTRAAPPTTNAESTWIGNNGGNDINIGHAETSAALWDPTAVNPITGLATGWAADQTVDLANLQYLRGTALVQPFNGVAAGDEITISFRKGGRKMSATFTYGNNDPDASGTGIPPWDAVTGDGTTLAHFMEFLNGDVGDDGVAASDQRLRGGAMGTVHTRARTTATDGYDVIAEHAGAFERRYVGTTDFTGAATAGSHSGAVDYDGDGNLDPTTKVSIGSNLGEENAITDIEISFNSVNYDDLFSEDADYGTVEGGSTTTNLIFYDSLGNSHEVTMQMALVGRDTNFSTWRWVADSTADTDASWMYKDKDGNPVFNQTVVDPAGYDQTAAGNPDRVPTSINVGTGLIRFDSEGRFVGGTELSSTGGIEIDLSNQGVNEPLNINIIEGLSSDLEQDLSFADLTQVAAAHDFNLSEQNGSPPGTLDSFTVTSDGLINGVYSNGVLEVLGQLVLAMVDNPQGFIQAGQNMYIEGPASGEPRIGFPETGGRGSIRAGTLELSNVDISEEFTNLIVTERGFQANARVISTSDEMLVELVNLKR